MNNEKEGNALWDEFFGVTDAGRLRDFARKLDISDAAQAALKLYIGTWEDVIEAAPTAAFDPGNYLSKDLSAVMYGKCPVIFKGTNEWCQKAYLPREQISERLNILHSKIVEVRRRQADTPLCVILVPEKDYVISRLFWADSRFDMLDEAIAKFSEDLGAQGVEVVYRQPILGMDNYMKLTEMEYWDSHLHGKNYIVIFSQALRALGLDWATAKPHVGLTRIPAYGDLSDKFSTRPTMPRDVYLPNVGTARTSLLAGSETFEDPLGKTWQLIGNEAPVIDRSVCILGDSHSSIFSKRHLTYLFASLYRRCEFFWNPCEIRGYSNMQPCDDIVMEISCRFVV